MTSEKRYTVRDFGIYDHHFADAQIMVMAPDKHIADMVCVMLNATYEADCEDEARRINAQFDALFTVLGRVRKARNIAELNKSEFARGVVSAYEAVIAELTLEMARIA